MSDIIAEVVGLNRFAVKSFGGESVIMLPVGPRGPAHDRRYMFARPEGKRKFMSQRDFPLLCLCQARLNGGTIVLSAPNTTDLELPLLGEGSKKTIVTMHKKKFQVTISLSMAGKWLGDFLTDRGVKIDFEPLAVFQTEEDERYVKPEARAPGIAVRLQDGYPFMALSTASLHDLNSRLPPGEPASEMDQFRPNIILGKCGAYAEDSITGVQVGDVTFMGESNCTRCATIQTNQHTGKRSKEPMTTLRNYRHTRNGSPEFGKNLSHLNTGTIRVGDFVRRI